MAEHILFLTGRLAEKQLRQTLAELAPEFTYTIHELGLSVAALMTAEMIRRRLTSTFGATRILVPGRCRGDLECLSKALGVPVERGPDELKDIPEFFGKRGKPVDLSRHALRIFAEIVDAPKLTVEAILERAARLRHDGADVIDIGCLPETPFPHLAESISALKAAGYTVSVDSLEPADLLAGAGAGADFLLSVHAGSLWIASAVDATPVLIPEAHGNLDSLERAIEGMQALGRPFLLDPVLDPIHFGFTDSLVRYREVRRRHPELPMMMGVGNLTELTHADTAGINALLLGICSELAIENVLTTQVSAHARRAIKEADVARRMMFAAKENHTLPKHIDDSLMALHETKPFLFTTPEVAELAKSVRDPSFRIVTSQDGVHIFNRDGLWTAQDPFELYSHLGVASDGGHAFYLGVELARAQIAWQLGKRYCQDEPLDWRSAAEPPNVSSDTHAYREPGPTLDSARLGAEPS